MKNFGKLVGFIAFLAVMVFSLIGCDDGEQEAFITVINQNSKPIIEVSPGYGSTSWTCNIVNGQSQTFSHKFYEGQTGYIGVYTSNGGPSTPDITYHGGETITVTYTSEGQLIRN